MLEKDVFTKKSGFGMIFASAALVLSATAIYFFATVAKGYSGRLLPIYSVETEEKEIALTFNCAWGAEDVSTVLETLDKYGAKATFFVLGTWARDNPDKIAEITEHGHEIGSHSNTHPDMTKQSREEIIDELTKAAKSITESGGASPTLFRAPSGAYDNELMTVAKEQGYTVIQWDTDSRDWKEPKVSDMVRSVVDSSREGSIVLMHCGAKPTAEALPMILEGLTKRGFTFVTVSELIYKENYTVNNEGRQIKITDSK